MNATFPDESHSREHAEQPSWPEDVVIPESFLCGLTKRLMKHPVIDREGNSYEKETIIRYLKQSREPGIWPATVLSPVTNNPLEESDLVDNRALQMAIESGLNNALALQVVIGHGARKTRNRRFKNLNSLRSSVKAAMPVMRKKFGGSSLRASDMGDESPFTCGDEHSENDHDNGGGKTSTTENNMSRVRSLENVRSKLKSKPSEHNVTAGGYHSDTASRSQKNILNSSIRTLSSGEEDNASPRRSRSDFIAPRGRRGGGGPAKNGNAGFESTGDECLDADIAKFLQVGTIGVGASFVGKSHFAPQSQQPKAVQQKALESSRRKASTEEREKNELSVKNTVKKKMSVDKAAAKFEERLRKKLSNDAAARSKVERKYKKTDSVVKLLEETDPAKIEKDKRVEQYEKKISQEAVNTAKYLPKRKDGGSVDQDEQMLAQEAINTANYAPKSTRELPDQTSSKNFEDLLQRKVKEYGNAQSQKQSHKSTAQKDVQKESRKGSRNRNHLPKDEAAPEGELDYTQKQKVRSRNRRERRNMLEKKISSRQSLTSSSMVSTKSVLDLNEDSNTGGKSDSATSTGTDYAQKQEDRSRKRRERRTMLDNKIRQSLTNSAVSKVKEGDLHDGHTVPSRPVQRVNTTESEDTNNEVTANLRASQRASLARMQTYTQSRRVSDLTQCSILEETSEQGISDSNHSMPPSDISIEIGIDKSHRSGDSASSVPRANTTSLAEQLTGGSSEDFRRRSSTGGIAENSAGTVHKKTPPADADQFDIDDVPDRKMPPTDLNDSIVSWSALDGEIERAQFMSMTLANTDAMNIQSEMEAFMAAGIELEPEADGGGNAEPPVAPQRRARQKRRERKKRQVEKNGDTSTLGEKVDALLECLDGSGKTRFDVINALKEAKGDKDRAMSMLLLFDQSFTESPMNN